MDRDTRVSQNQYSTIFSRLNVDMSSEGNGELKKDEVSINSVLPDDVLERILANLPVACIFRASCVCRRWNEIVTSERFLWNFSSITSQENPWYFMITDTDDFSEYSYDPTYKKWYSIDLPYFVNTNWFIASSVGLVCFMNNASKNELYVSNPVTRSTKQLIEPPGASFSHYTALAISVNKKSRNYNISIVKSTQVLGNFCEWDISILLYKSETMSWTILLTEVLDGWRTGDQSIICNGALYFLLYSTRTGTHEHRHALIKYNLSNCSSQSLLTKNLIPAPCSLTCLRLMNLNERLVMVGGIGKKDRSDIIKGIGIWVLKRSKWEEVARMPQKYFQGFGEFHEVFASSGAGDVIYIQSYASPALLFFDMSQKQWKWSHRSPITKKFSLQLFTGFCFEPRFELSP